MPAAKELVSSHTDKREKRSRHHWILPEDGVTPRVRSEYLVSRTLSVTLLKAKYLVMVLYRL